MYWPGHEGHLCVPFSKERNGMQSTEHKRMERKFPLGSVGR
uniref:Uncharacterized protein n=1 Tax=Romanomermis culicivorax TaxID=13658 RepID=A0A915HNT8_ROMCU